MVYFRPFLSKDGKTRRMREETNGKVVLFTDRISLSIFWNVYDEIVFSYVYLDLVCKQLCFSPGKIMNRETKVQDTQLSIQNWWLTILSADANVQYSSNSYIIIFETVEETNLVFLQPNDNQVLIADLYFSRRKRQLWGKREYLQQFTMKIVRNILGNTWHETQKSQITRRLHKSSFRGNWGKSNEKVVFAVQ